jgi:hypothetical protein
MSTPNVTHEQKLRALLRDALEELSTGCWMHECTCGTDSDTVRAIRKMLSEAK